LKWPSRSSTSGPDAQPAAVAATQSVMGFSVVAGDGPTIFHSEPPRIEPDAESATFDHVTEPDTAWGSFRIVPQSAKLPLVMVLVGSGADGPE